MNTKPTRLALAVLSLFLVAGSGSAFAQTVSLTPEQLASLEARKREYERQFAAARALADAQRRTAEMEANVQRQALEFAEKEATRAKVAANFAMADTMVSATKAGFEGALPGVDRQARAARVKMATAAISSWTPPAGYRYERPKDASLQNPFDSAATTEAQVHDAPAVTLEASLAGTCLEVDPELRIVRVGAGCGEGGFDGRVAEGLYPVTADGHLLDTPERARRFIAQTKEQGASLLAFSSTTQQVVLVASKEGKP